ncbi:glycosyltransferase [Staphylococcus pseudintermedius]|uniref:Glycosyl transferase family 1 n=9 Tax=Staphylococcus pseudintermedius TaxID=283734 RepID=A0A317Z3H7_STAPS|nr:glycosyltransferase [Staphylococcus pseudintermedius]EGQ1588835.1 glycosyltransferase [Staphylococcus pseudintermedius]EGQ1648618.1 glycosyltransferase [Staphylococcus pseudintermedius]EGQ1678132.1 glycosyltransferase [Staphylococcus pseudintermedius]EGQ1725213.1 glycosyltransferase [Staphylococcus pseudintermedius]
MYKRNEEATMLYTITSTLPEVHGGRTKSLLKRIQFMENHFQESHTILTTNYNPNYPRVMERFRERQILSEDTKVVNIYEWFTNGKIEQFPYTKFKKKPKYHETPIEIKGLSYQQSKKDAKVFRYYKEDTYMLYRKYYDIELGILHFEDVMLPSQKHKVERREYNEFGYLHRVILYDKKDNFKLSETLYDRDGEVYCIRHFKENKVSHIHLYQNGNITHAFDDEKDFFTYFFENVIEANSKVFNDARLLDRAILNVSQPIKNIFMIHSSHKNVDDSIKKSFGIFNQRVDEIDQIVVLTEQQKQDMIEDFNISAQRISVLPHFMTIHEPQHVERKQRFLYIGRIDENKQLSHILKAFKIYQEAGYDYGLDIYGHGESRPVKQMEQYIRELNLGDKVQFHGKTNQPGKVFSQHAASLLTSQFEGFSLAVMESINNGCPVLAYDIRYGPREMIKSGENGYLVEPQNIEDLADKMMKITEHPITDVKLDDRFGIQHAEEKYAALLQSVE